MARRIVSLDEKIEKAEAVMLEAKAKYDKALDEMENWSKSGKSKTIRRSLMPITLAPKRQRKSLLLSSLTIKKMNEC